MPVSVEHTEKRKLRAHILNHRYVVESKPEIPNTFSFKKRVYSDIILQEGGTNLISSNSNTFWGLGVQILEAIGNNF